MIAAAEAQRNIAINLTMIANPGNQAVVQKEVKQILAAQQTITKAAIEGASLRLNSILDELKKGNQAFQEFVKSTEAAEKKRVKQVKKSNKEIVDSVDTMSKKLEAAIIGSTKKYEKLQKKQIKQSKKNNKALVATIEDMAKKTESILEKMEKKITEITEKESQKRKKKREKETGHVKKLEKLNRTKIDSYRKATEAGLGALQGTMDLAEGLANMGLISEESFKEFEQGFQKVEAGFKALKGFTELVWKGREALVAMSAATKAQAASNALLSNSNYRTAASQTVMKTAAGAAGVGGSGAAGLGAVGVAGTGITVGSAAAAAGVAAGIAAAGLVAFEGFQALRRGIFGASDSTESFVGAIMSYREAAKEAEESTKQLEKAYNRRREQEEQLAIRSQVDSRQFAGRQTARGSTALVRQVEFEISGNNRDSIKAVNEQREQAIIAVREAEEEYQAVLIRNQELFKLGQPQDEAARVRTAKNLEDAGQRLLAKDRQRLQVLRDQKQNAEDQLKTIDQQQKSKEAQIGELSRPRRKRFEELTEKYNQVGPQGMSGVEVRQLKRFGPLGSKMVTEILAHKGREAGGVELLRKSGNLEAEDKARQKNQDTINRTNDAEMKSAVDNTRASAKQQKVARAGRIEAEERSAAAQNGKSLRAKIKTDRDNAEPETTIFNELFNKPSRNIPKEIYNSGLAPRVAEATVSPLLFINRLISDRIGQSISGGEDQPQLDLQGSIFRQNNPERPAVNNQNGNRNPQRAAGEAVDTITKESIEVTQSLKVVLDAVAANLAKMREAMDNHELVKGSYNK
ncbi:hypothetical protein [uncultured Gimesia sp.]|uniref:hypothetical protein n=1 Tax=uncultured Gimesia sp. TaxID=1678688 RepID=UPI0030DAB41C|tara:strand:+ start:97183 stop:99585 length:2403 start_codon:yes stop_codon:yes gene_type:complete